MKETIPVSVCIDFKDPSAYLAWQPTLDLSEALSITFDWLPFVSPVKHSAPELKLNTREARHKLMRYQYRQMDLIRYAGKSILSLSAINRNVDSKLASIGLLWCKQQSSDIAMKYIEETFKACWKSELDISEKAVIRAVLAKAGAALDLFDEFCDTTGNTQLASLQKTLKNQGVFDTPAYLLEGELFVGRQHLPMMRWLLTGKQGQRPI
ncbi:MAG: DsbA family protein [Pseudomonadales bacterium]|nr:DsbA family protein [Pseudomonadales bacterium]